MKKTICMLVMASVILSMAGCNASGEAESTAAGIASGTGQGELDNAMKLAGEMDGRKLLTDIDGDNFPELVLRKGRVGISQYEYYVYVTDSWKQWVQLAWKTFCKKL